MARRRPSRHESAAALRSENNRAVWASSVLRQERRDRYRRIRDEACSVHHVRRKSPINAYVPSARTLVVLVISLLVYAYAVRLPWGVQVPPPSQPTELVRRPDQPRPDSNRVIPWGSFRSWDLGKLIVPIQILLVTGLGVLTAWIVVVEMGIHGSAVAVFCLITPLLVVLVFSDRLSEISGGGLTIKIRKAGKRPVKTLMVEAVTPAYLPLDKASAEQLMHWISQHEDDYLLPVVLSLREGQRYDSTVFVGYLTQLSSFFPRFSFVVILDQDGRHICHIAPAVILGWRSYDRNMDLQDRRRLVNSLLHKVEQSDTSALLQLPGMRRDTVAPSTRVDKALRIMNASKSRELLVIDSERHPKGVVEQETALSKFVLALTS
jgi:hypothetical protein